MEEPPQYWSLTDKGEGKYPTSAHSTHPVPPEGGEKNTKKPEKHM